MNNYRTTQEVKAEFRAKPRRALLLTTVVHESRAVQAHIIEVEKIAGADGAIYELGRFPDPAGDWYIVHALTKAGNSDASAVATKALGEFGKFDVLMFVGVAGSLKEDIPVGSVVVGDYVYNSHSGKSDDTQYYSRPHSHPAAPELLKAAQMLMVDGDWVDLIKNPKRMKLPDVKNYPCPFPPKAFLKSIASGEEVVAGGNTRTYQRIRLHLSDAGAVEMEGWGVMNAALQERTSAIIVRGISDLCQGKTHESDALSQPIAAAHASAFAFALLSLRSRANPLTIEGSAFSEQISRPELEKAAPDPRGEFVVNFRVALSEWPESRVHQIIEGLRKATGDPDLTLLRVDEGSGRLVVRVREKDLPALTLETVRTAAGILGGQLLGAVSGQDLAEAESAKTALKQASANLLTWEQELPGGGWLERPEKREIEFRFHSEFSSTVLLGEPGSGKSALSAAIATDLIKAKSPVLAIKADFVSTKVHSELDLQADLQLPILPSKLIECLAQLQPVYLIVDQLDALASQVDLRSDRLNALLNLIRRVGGLSNVHILISARTFEFNHDVRLRAIDVDSVTLTLPPWHLVNEKLSAAGIDAGTWPENARDVVRNPQALKTYLSLSTTIDDQPFTKYQALQEQLWRQKIALAPDGEAQAVLISELAGTMAEEEVLWLAASRFDNRASTLERLESIGVIVRSDNGQSIAFSHQTVFDYVLARSFVKTSGRLSSYVLERQNSLFVRAKLWSALRYLRDAEVAAYQREFSEIWTCLDLRRHIRLLLIEFMGENREPVAFEKIYMQQVMESEDLRFSGLKAIIGSSGWFKNFAKSAIPLAMDGPDREVNQALKILQKAWDFAPDNVSHLLREKWLSAPAKDSLLWSALDMCPSWNETVEEMAHTILARTPIHPEQVDYTASAVAVKQPEVALKLIRSKLDFLLESSRPRSFGEPYPEGGTEEKRIEWKFLNDPSRPLVEIAESTSWDCLRNLAEADPEKFLVILWPWYRAFFIELKNTISQQNDLHHYPGNFAVALNFKNTLSKYTSHTDNLLSILLFAIERIAQNDKEAFLVWAAESSAIDLTAPQLLVAHGFNCAPEAYAQQAFRWLLSDLRRFQLGNLEQSLQTTCALVSAASPYWADKQLEEFELQVHSYRPTTPARLSTPQARSHFNKFIRRTRAQLLAAITSDRSSQKATALIAMEKRASGGSLNRGVSFSGPEHVGSPMEAAAMSLAKDRDILKIFKEVPDHTDWDHPTSWMRGGNIQLSRAFAEFAKAEPTRALRIIEQFEPLSQERAAGYALLSIAELPGQDRAIQDALLDLYHRGFGAAEFRISVANAIEKLANHLVKIDEAVIMMLTDWLAEPMENSETFKIEAEEAEVVERPSQGISEKNHPSSIIWGYGGIGFLPGGNFPVLSALAVIFLNEQNGGRDRLITILNEHLAREKDPRVWQSFLHYLSNAGGSKPEIVSNFIRNLFARFPSLLQTRDSVYFLAYAQRWDTELVRGVITAWEYSGNSMLRQAFGELVGLCSAVHRSEQWVALQDRLIECGSAEAKIGLAYAGANLWVDQKFRSTATSLIERLVLGADEDRMFAILDIFRLCDDLLPEPHTLALLRALAEPGVNLFGASPSPFIVEKLQTLLPHAVDIIGEIALNLVNSWRNELSDSRASRALEAPQLTNLAITLHRLGGESREIGILLFEILLDIDAYGARDTLTEIDGRFGIHQTSARRRITRRRGKQHRSV